MALGCKKTRDEANHPDDTSCEPNNAENTVVMLGPNRTRNADKRGTSRAGKKELPRSKRGEQETDDA